jgi:hypothetical protein
MGGSPMLTAGPSDSLSSPAPRAPREAGASVVRALPLVPLWSGPEVARTQDRKGRTNEPEMTRGSITPDKDPTNDQDQAPP